MVFVTFPICGNGLSNMITEPEVTKKISILNSWKLISFWLLLVPLSWSTSQYHELESSRTPSCQTTWKEKKPRNSWTALSKKCIFFPFQVVWHDGVRELPNSWQWLVEHDNGTGSNQKEINVELSRINLGLPLICKVNSSALDAPISKKIHGLWNMLRGVSSYKINQTFVQGNSWHFMILHLRLFINYVVNGPYM